MKPYSNKRFTGTYFDEAAYISPEMIKALSETPKEEMAEIRDDDPKGTFRRPLIPTGEPGEVRDS